MRSVSLATRRSYPLVFHCAAGKDRTGVLAALILDIVGVERQAIVEDYVLTASSTGGDCGAPFAQESLRADWTMRFRRAR
jgi:protein tyrosine/serine phosphatase